MKYKIEGQINCFPGKVKLKEFIVTEPLLYGKLNEFIFKEKIKTMNSKMTTNSHLSTTEPKKTKQTKQTIKTGTESQKWNHMEGY